MRTRKRRLGAATAALALCGSLLVAFATGPVASADTVPFQSNGCISITPAWSTFPIPITGTAAPKPILTGGTTTLSGTGIVFGVTTDLIVAGTAIPGLISQAPDKASIGTGAPPGLGVNNVVLPTGAATLKITGTN